VIKGVEKLLRLSPHTPCGATKQSILVAGDETEK